MKTSWLSENEIKREWYIIDVSDEILGRVSTVIARLIIGKDKVDRVPNMDCGDYVVVINASEIKMTGNKKANKKYYRHSGYPGGLKIEEANKLLKTKPQSLITRAVKRMLPTTKHKDARMNRLKVFAGNQHTHEAQKPEKVDLKLFL